jgi:DNA helicase-2/ATP-dependent DNA helicase PcrA
MWVFLLMELNEEQIKAATHPQGEAALLLAGAGSGKTTTLTERISWLIGQGVPPRKILAITFTNKAAGEIRERVLKRTGLSEDQAPRLSTIHSLALSMIRRNPQGFGLGAKISPLDDYDQKQLVKKIIQREEVDVDPYDLLEHIAFHRARGVGFRVDYTDDVHERALVGHAGYHAMGQQALNIWELYEIEKRDTNSVDFDDMLWIVLRRMENDPEWLVKLQSCFAHVIMDESQDTNIPQFKLITNLLGPDNRNLFITGDLGQCQPPETAITVLESPMSSKGIGNGRGKAKASFTTRRIDEFVDGDGVISWTRIDQQSYATPRQVRVASRAYSGPMLTIHTENGYSTRVTPNHRLWVRFNKQTSGKYLLYVMFRSDLGYRIGVTKFKTCEHSASGFGLTGRLNRERGHKAWILRVFDTRQEAEAWEEIISLKYGIPESVYCVEHACRNKTQEMIKLIFSYARPEGAEQCLLDHGLYLDAPIIERSDDATVNNCNRHWRGYFETPAANVGALAGLVDIPLQGVNAFAAISSITSEHYEGLVYSFDVEKDHTYVADGLVVGNSIYGFNGAAPYLIKEFSQDWRGHAPTLYRLVTNHRSVPEIVDFANAIQDHFTNSLPLTMASFREKLGHHGRIRRIRGQDPVEIASKTASHILNSDASLNSFAVLVRSSMQIRDLEGEFVRNRIPYVVRGGRSLLQTEEVRDVLAYMRFAINTHDFSALARATAAPKRGIGDVALETLRTLGKHKFAGDLLLASAATGGKCTSFAEVIRVVQARINNPVDALNAVIQFTGYADFIKRKYVKDPKKVETKIDNLRRLRMMIEGMAADSVMTVEDMIFQLTMEKPKEDDERGAVTISTIHSAKGLEWDTVIVNSVVESQLPHWRSTGTDEEIDEERRLWYVAVTRARDVCFIAIPERVQHGQGMREVDPSRFLEELGAA